MSNLRKSNIRPTLYVQEDAIEEVQEAPVLKHDVATSPMRMTFVPDLKSSKKRHISEISAEPPQAIKDVTMSEISAPKASNAEMVEIKEVS